MKEQNKKLDTVIENTANAKSTDVDTEAVKRNTVEKEKQALAQEAYTQVEISNTKANLENAASLAQSEIASKAYSNTEISNANAKSMDTLATEAQTNATREKIFADEENIAVSKVYTTVASSNASLDLELAAAKGAYTTAEISNARAKELSTVASGEAIFADTTLAVTEGTATVATNVFSGALVKLGTALKSLATSHPILLALAVGFAAFKGISAIIDASTTSIKEQEEAFENANEEYEKAKNELSSLRSELSSTTDSITKLQDKANNGTITLVEEDELEKLKETNKELELQVKNQEIIEKQKKKEASDSAVDTFKKKNQQEINTKVYDSSFDNGKFALGSFKTNASNVEEYDYAISENKSKIEEYKNTISNLESDLAKETDETEKEIIQNDINNTNDLINNLTSSNEDLATSAKSMAEETFSDKISEYDEYKKTLMQSMSSDGTFDDEEYQNAWDKIQEREKNLYKYTGKSGEWNEIQFKADIDDSTVKSFFSEIDSKSSTAQNELDKLNQLSEEFNASVNGNVDYSKRPYISPEKMKEAGWSDFNAPVATTYSSGYDIEDSNGEIMHIEISPVLPNGDVLSPEELDNYVYDVLEGSSDVLASDKESIVIDFSYDKSKFNDEYYDSLADIKNAHYETMKELANKLGTDIFNLDINSISDEISKLSNNEIITSDDVRNSTTFSSYLNKANLSLEEGQDAAEALAKYLNEAKKSANEISNSGAWEDPTSIYEESDNKNNASTGKASTLADLQSEADLLSTINKEITENGNISVSSLSSIIKQYPEALKYLAQYNQGVITQAELFEKLGTIYDSDKNSYINDVIAKSETDADFWNAVYGNSVEVQNSLAAVYGDDFNGFKNLAQAKQELDDTLMEGLKANWGEYLAYIAKAADGTYSLMTQMEAEVSYIDDAVGGDAAHAEDALQINNDYNKFDSSKTEALKNFIDNINESVSAINNAAYDQVNSALDLSWEGLSDDSGSSSDSDSDSSKEYNWIERKINAISKAYDKLKSKVSDTTRIWAKRNSNLVDSMSVLSDEIEAQAKSYAYYMSQFNSYDLDDHYKDLIVNGAISTEMISDEGLQDAIDAAQSLYDSAIDASDAVDTLSQELYSLSQTHFDNLNSQFEEQISLIEHENATLQSRLDLLEAKGYNGSSNTYNKLITNEQSNIAKLKEQYKALTDERDAGLTSGSVEKYSETWYSMTSSINSVEEAIQEANKSLVEFQNSLRQLKWDAFDRMQDNISSLTSESNFLIDLFGDDNLTDDNGKLTDNGNAVIGLHNQNIEVYKKQAEEYKNEINKINAELANDPYNNTLLDRKKELIEAQQEAIKSAQDEKKSIEDLIENSYTAYEDSLSKIIDKYKDLMSTIKDAWDYQNNMADKTDALAKLQKQYAAYANDDSEEGKKTKQELETQIKDAEKDIKQTEYDKLVSDTEKILDDLQDEVKTEFDGRMDNIDNYLKDLVDKTDDASVSETIRSMADSVNYTLTDSMSDIWNNSSTAGSLQTIASTLNDMYTFMQTSLTYANAEAQGTGWAKNDDGKWNYFKDNKQVKDSWTKYKGEWYHLNEDGNMDTNKWVQNKSGTWSYVDDSGAAKTGWQNLNWKGTNDWYYFDQDGTMDTDKWINDYFVNKSGRMLTNTWVGHNGKYYWVGSDGKWQDLDGWTLDHKPVTKNSIYEYAKGSKRISSNQDAWTQEEGSEIIRTSDGALLTRLNKGDSVFTSGMSDTLWDFASNPGKFMGDLSITPSVTNTSTPVAQYSVGDVSLVLPNVNDYEDFCRQAQSDPRFTKMIQEMSLGQAFGNNSLSKKVF